MSFYDDFENTTPENEENDAVNSEDTPITEANEEIQDAPQTEDVVADNESSADEPVLEDNNEAEPTEDTNPYDTTKADDFIPEDEEVPETVDPEKKSVAPIVALIVIIAAIIIGLVVYIAGKNSNPYNKLGYVNTSGKTIADVAEDMGISVEDFLAQFDLPEDMPADTNETAAFYSMPFKSVASMYGTDVQTLKEELNIPDETTELKPKTLKGKILSFFKRSKPVPIDENTPWGVVEGEITIGSYYGEEYVQEFKDYYGLGDDVTADTKIKEIRDELNKKTLELMEEQKVAEEQNTEDSASEDEADTEETAETVDDAETESAENTQEASSEAE